jgi:hypothetical protein
MDLALYIPDIIQVLAEAAKRGMVSGSCQSAGSKGEGLHWNVSHAPGKFQNFESPMNLI